MRWSICWTFFAVRRLDSHVSIRPTTVEDLPILFDLQNDFEAYWQVALMQRDFDDRDAFMTRLNEMLEDAYTRVRTICERDSITGFCVTFVLEEEVNVGYWLGREFMGRGIVTDAMRRFLTEIDERPLYARVVYDNDASQRVVQKLGFVEIRRSIVESRVRGVDVEEILYQLA